MLQESIFTLEKTPLIIRIILRGWEDIQGDDQKVREILGHLIEGEKTEWLPKIRMILNQRGKISKILDIDEKHPNTGKGLLELLDNFDLLRQQNIFELRNMDISENDLKMRAEHETLGLITVENLLSTWVYHDNTHIAQLLKEMGKPFWTRLGPWKSEFRN